ncbi:LL-diaminopimelate aminotransferase [Gemmatimonadetes bacterium T265]|nr:LL-diaminopimelate aminotransferase [Gemmatimonadetes bacterium T265]
MPRTADRFRTLPTYPMAHVPVRKRELLAAGRDVIDLGPGDADLAPPPAAVDALRAALEHPAMHRYGFGLGHVPFREAIARWMRRRFGLTFDPVTEVCPLLGSKEGIVHFCGAFLQRGDVAVVPEPGYLAYLGGTLLNEAEVYAYPIRPRTNFLVELDELPDDVLRRTKLVFVNYPNNPTAAVAPRDYLERTVRLCRERDILVVYDNAYSEIAFDGYVPPSIFEIPGARDVAVEFHSLSKTYNMTGWRQGWAVGNADLIGALAKVKSFIDTGSFLPIQVAGVAALESWAEFVPRNVATFQERRDAGVAAFRAAGFACETPKAAMYLWLEVPDGIPSREFTDRLMDEEALITIAGSSFGAGGEGFFRASLIVPPERLRDAAARAARVLAAMRAERAALPAAA